MQSKPKPLVIPIFIPHQGCPHKCAFCDQSVITNEKHSLKSAALPDQIKINKEVDNYLAYRGNRSSVELAFFGGNFLGLAPQDTKNLLLIAGKLIKEKKIDSIRCSTRPDTIHEKSLEMARSFNLDTVEIGVQSMDNEVLSRAKRGHTAQNTIKAAKLLDDYGIKKGMQMMVGLPGDTNAKAIETAREIAGLNPAFVRIYPLMVLKNSLVHYWYIRGEYTPMALDDCVDLVSLIHEIFENSGIPVIRMGLQASDLLQEADTMVAGPWHPAFGHLVFSKRMLNRVMAKLDQEPRAKKKSLIILKVNPVTESQLRGNRNKNLKILTTLYPKAEIKIDTDHCLAIGQLLMNISS